MTPRKILIVEDCADVLDLLGVALTLLGWETILADSGQEAMNKLEQDLPTVVLINLRTPVRNGIKLAASLKAHPAYEPRFNLLFHSVAVPQAQHLSRCLKFRHSIRSRHFDF